MKLMRSWRGRHDELCASRGGSCQDHHRDFRISAAFFTRSVPPLQHSSPSRFRYLHCKQTQHPSSPTMAQGLIKKASSKPSTSSHSKSSGITKKGSRTIAPRKQRLQKQAKITKKFTSGLTAGTEKMLGEKVGHLEMIGKGKDKMAGTGGKQSKGGKKGGKKG